MSMNFSARDGWVLLCTVGGSHAPVVSALRSRPWARVVFVCSAATARSKSSRSMIDDRVEVGYGAEKRTLPSIPAQAELSSDSFETRSEEHTSELQSLMRISYAVFCLKKKNNNILNKMN